jgi:hypothetical protein
VARIAHEADMKSWIVPLPALLLIVLTGCGKEVVKPGERRGTAPDTQITLAPVEGDSVSFRVHLYWNGYDSDGEVVAYRWAVDPDSQDLRRLWRWPRTTATDTVLAFTVDPVHASKGHVFMVAAEDNAGNIDPTPAMRYFAATTLPPVSRIETGPAEGSLVRQDVTFTFSGEDPDGGAYLGQIIRSAPVDSFQCLLLWVGHLNDYAPVVPPWHQPLPDSFGPVYYDLIGQATGDSLLYPHGDWKWTGVRGGRIRYANLSPGEYVFAVRAVDIAGAREQGITANAAAIHDHVRHFTAAYVPPLPRSPSLSVTANVCFGSLAQVSPIVSWADPSLQMFEGEPISFAWSATAWDEAGQIIGYDFALDDSTGLGAQYDAKLLGVTLGPDRLTPGDHVLYVRCLDSGGYIATAVLPFTMVHPSFKDPGAPREILYVDDSLSPGNTPYALGSFPSDVTETDWYLTVASGGTVTESRFPRIADAFPGVTITEWDTYQQGMGSVDGRKAPGVGNLAGISTVVWIADANNTTSTPIALWKTVVGGSYSALAGYLRAGGTLIVSGYNVVDCTTDPRASLKNRTAGLCAAFTPGSFEWKLDYVPRLFMGVDYMTPSEDGRRALGARDFVAAYPTAAGAALGFDTAFVDTGPPATGAKWNTNSNLTGTYTYLDQNLSPGLLRIEGWHMASEFGCEGDAAFGREDPAVPIAQPVYTYHGVPLGVLQDGGPSPREGLVCGLLCQSHDLGPEWGGTGVYNPTAAAGRSVFLGFPLYFLHDQRASDILFNAFSFVNASPTLP